MVWQVNAQWKPDAAMKSEVDVRFSADGPDATQVELLHPKFETMGAEAGASMRKDVDGGWPGLIERFAREAERSTNQAAYQQQPRVEGIVMSEVTIHSRPVTHAGG